MYAQQRREPVYKRWLPRSKWTSCVPTCGFTHWTVIEVSGDHAVLQSVLDPATTHRLAWRALRDRAQWLPGWVAPPEPAPTEPTQNLPPPARRPTLVG